jgi:hypothetical protein
MNNLIARCITKLQHVTRVMYIIFTCCVKQSCVCSCRVVPVVVDVCVVLMIRLREPRLYKRAPTATLLTTTTMLTATATYFLNRHILRYNAVFFRFKLHYKQLLGGLLYSFINLFSFKLVKHKMTNALHIIAPLIYAQK